MLLPSFLEWQAGWRNDWVNNSGITRHVFDDAVSAFITEVISIGDKSNHQNKKILDNCKTWRTCSSPLQQRSLYCSLAANYSKDVPEFQVHTDDPRCSSCDPLDD
ncbi:hypothetical protein GCK72_011884 [Caenorhabditis remanei]|uniref:Uncharacterized protein n=1 Tax=Caenorhabditis remanei TaxID=31234 RepID=A0A6A5H8R6_CAERE|nr:hypothetical protein GCK72_011884 [Caenorhabditis remanei]KAF1763617.1 hypothetical protein GCK72_011884 [Caenorhabditis remanei]